MTISWALTSCLLIAVVLLLRFALGRNISARLRLYAGASSGLRVQSKPGLGTRVTLTLPWRAAR